MILGFGGDLVQGVRGGRGVPHLVSLLKYIPAHLFHIFWAQGEAFLRVARAIIGGFRVKTVSKPESITFC